MDERQIFNFEKERPLVCVGICDIANADKMQKTIGDSDGQMLADIMRMYTMKMM